ncbi:hypothetical protein ZIOFF_048884 [Zingiber officinale]|uniref:S-locus glycoprotein domain-containing protein n=1 Tax=Zingiber officinale TaxID=94328 RepID=A0A8J5G034_ZINOF|nr:hypothetical protein ZIOFF_048884 [Zingiber officinale]
MYWKHSVLEAEAQIIPGRGAIYARVGEGFLGIYQTEAAPVNVLPFNTFNRRIHGLRLLTLESDGNLRAYYWNGSIWIEDLRAIADRCEIPTSCGAYGLCNLADGGCGCVREKGVCQPAIAGNFCDAGSNEFRILMRKGVDLANDELTDSAQKGGVSGGMRGLVRAELQLLGSDLPQLLGVLLSIGLPDYSGGCQRRRQRQRRRRKEESEEGDDGSERRFVRRSGGSGWWVQCVEAAARADAGAV